MAVMKAVMVATLAMPVDGGEAVPPRIDGAPAFGGITDMARIF